MYIVTQNRGKGDEVASHARALRTSARVACVTWALIPLVKGSHSAIPDINEEEETMKVLSCNTIS